MNITRQSHICPRLHLLYAIFAIVHTRKAPTWRQLEITNEFYLMLGLCTASKELLVCSSQNCNPIQDPYTARNQLQQPFFLECINQGLPQELLLWDILNEDVT